MGYLRSLGSPKEHYGLTAVVAFVNYLLLFHSVSLLILTMTLHVRFSILIFKLIKPSLVAMVLLAWPGLVWFGLVELIPESWGARE